MHSTHFFLFLALMKVTHFLCFRLIYEPEMYQCSVSEGAAVGTPVGRVIATDADMGENTDMTYLIKDGAELFKVTTDVETQEAVVSIKKVQSSNRAEEPDVSRRL